MVSPEPVPGTGNTGVCYKDKKDKIYGAMMAPKPRGFWGSIGAAIGILDKELELKVLKCN